MVQTLRLGRLEYTVEITGKPCFTHILRGPRGGVIEGIRNVHSGRIILMRGAKKLPWELSDASGTIVVIEV